MPTIEIQALDTLFFRDGKPFEMGDDNWAEGIFPPPPSVIYGALRSAYFAEHPADLALANTEKDPTKELRIKNILLKKGNDLFFASPLDYVQQKDNTDKNFPLKLIPADLFANNYSLRYVSYPALIEDDIIKTSNVESINKYIERVDFKDYLKEGLENDLVFTEIDEFYQIEPKIGVGLNNQTRNSAEGKLYRVGMLRMNEVEKDENVFEKNKIVVEYDFGFNFIPKTIRFGAENKIAKVSETDTFNLNIELNRSKFLKIILKTPGIFKKDWKPNIENILKNIDITLIAAFVGKYQNFGGWNIIEKKPKEMRKAVPAGSVFYYKINDDKTNCDIQEILKRVNSISDYRVNEGFGLFSVGNLLFDELLIKRPW